MSQNHTQPENSDENKPLLDPSILQSASADPYPDISMVIPIYKEEESLQDLYKELTEVLTEIGRSYEVIAVDDGSDDRSFEILSQIHEVDNRWHIISFRRNFGQTAGMSAGFDAARGKAVITIDADLQNDPRDIPKLLAKWEEGFDIVSGWRQDRKENYLIRRLPSKTANALISRTTGVHLHDYGCTLKVYDREVAKGVELYGELHRFVPAVASSMGVRVAEVPVNDRARKFGSSKYGIGRTFRVVIDLTTVLFLLKYARRPMHIFGTLGFMFAFLGTIVGLYLSYERLVLDMGLSERPLLLLAILLVILGVQMISIGLVAEIVMRTYYNPQGQPAYSIRHRLDAASQSKKKVTARTKMVMTEAEETTEEKATMAEEQAVKAIN